MSLVNSVTRDEIPKAVVDHWFIMYGKQITKEEEEELEKDEIKL